MVIQVRYQESQVCEVITDPSVEARLPTMMLVQDILDDGSLSCAVMGSEIKSVANASKVFLISVVF